MKKKFCVELYGKDDIRLKDFVFDSKSEQLEKYYELLGAGYRKSDIIKLTRWFYCK